MEHKRESEQWMVEFRALTGISERDGLMSSQIELPPSNIVKVLRDALGERQGTSSGYATNLIDAIETSFDVLREADDNPLMLYVTIKRMLSGPELSSEFIQLITRAIKELSNTEIGDSRPLDRCI